MAAVGSRGLGVTPQDMVRRPGVLHRGLQASSAPADATRGAAAPSIRWRRTAAPARRLADPLSCASPFLLPPCSQDASRLVFVSVKDAKPKRKVAVPIGDGSSWDQFCGQVRWKRWVWRRDARAGCGPRARLPCALHCWPCLLLIAHRFLAPVC